MLVFLLVPREVAVARLVLNVVPLLVLNDVVVAYAVVVALLVPVARLV